MLLDFLLSPRVRLSVAVSAWGALVLSVVLAGAVSTPAHAAALGSVTVSPTTGSNETLFGGTIANAQCPAGTDSAFWSMEGGDLTPNTYAAYLGDGTNSAGTGAQEFSGASVANIKTVTGQMTTAGTYRVVFHCFAGPTETNTYEVPFTYDPAGSGSWTAAATTVPGAPAKPAVSAPTAGGSATVSWAAPSSNGGAAITGYKIQVIKNGTVQPTLISATTSPKSVTGLANGTPYTFKVAAVNSVGMGAFSAASNSVTPRVATKLVITTAPTLVTYGVATKIVGRLTLSNGTTAVAGQSVALQVRKRGTTNAFVTVATVGSSSTGYVTYTTYKPTYAIDYRLTRGTAGAYLGTTSPQRSAVIRRNITRVWSASSIFLGRTVTLSGKVYPGSYGKAIYLQRKSGTSWVTVTSRTVHSCSGYSFSVKPTARGTYYYRLVMKSDATYYTSVSYAPALKVS